VAYLVGTFAISCLLSCDGEGLSRLPIESADKLHVDVAPPLAPADRASPAALVAEVMKEKRFDAFKELLEANQVPAKNLRRFGFQTNWPAESASPGFRKPLSVLPIVRDVSKIRVGARDFIVVAALATYEPPSGLQKIGMALSDVAFLFDSEGSLIAKFGGTVGEDRINGSRGLVAKFGVEGP
jgi:hypothetical protein